MRTPETAIKVSGHIYDRIKQIAEATDRGIRETADLLLTERLEALDHLGRMADGLGSRLADHLELSKDDLLGPGKHEPVYSCSGCGHAVSFEEKPEACPKCGVILDWEKAVQKNNADKAKNGINGTTNWAVIAILALAALRGMPIKV